MLSLSACGGIESVDPEAATLRVDLEPCRAGVGNRATAVSIGDGIAVTAAHSFDDVESFRLVGGEASVPGELVFFDRERDVALVRFDPTDLDTDAGRGLDLSVETLPPGAQVDMVVHRETGPATVDVEIVRSAQITLDGVGERFGYELSGRVEKGDSGAPLVDDEGAVVGVVFAASRTDDRGWAIATAEFVDAVGAVGAPVDLTCG